MLRACLAALLLAGGGSLGGCAASGTPNGAFAMATDSPTVAFESIDGPPPQVFDRMVGMLDSESKLRNLSIVSRDGQAAYRVRSYLAAQVVGDRTMIAWVWDVYDRNQQRTLRLSGEEPAGKVGRDPWSAADDMVLRKIAQAGFSGLSSIVNGTPDRQQQPSTAPAKQEPAVAGAEPTLPSAAGGIIALGYTER
jgi:hypothetical protein